MVIAGILAPVPQKTLQTNIARYRRLGNPRAVVADLIREGRLQQQTIEGMTYVWPPRSMPLREGPCRVQFLAPFDPVVWDRRRFEHLWGWPYRFEAYTPPSKRIRGYYAMPLLWGDKVIGWANAQVSGGQLNVEVGFVGKRPSEKSFRSELELEIGRLDTLKTHWNIHDRQSASGA